MSSGYGVIPPPAELRKMQSLGLTQAQIAEEVYKATGFRVTRNAVSMAMKRAGLSKPAKRYEELVPWRVKEAHQRHYALIMLRHEARRRRDLPIAEDWQHRLESWLHKLEKYNKVVLYEPDSPDGFYYVPRLPEDDDIIRKPLPEA